MKDISEGCGGPNDKTGVQREWDAAVSGGDAVLREAAEAVSKDTTMCNRSVCVASCCAAYESIECNV